VETSRRKLRIPYFPHGYAGQKVQHLRHDQHPVEPFAVRLCIIYFSWITARRSLFASQAASFLLLRLSSPRSRIFQSSTVHENQPADCPPTDPAPPCRSSRPANWRDRVLFSLDPRTVVEILNPGSSLSLLSFLPYLDLARCFPFVFRHPSFRRETNLPRDPPCGAHERFTWPTTRTELSQDRPTERTSEYEGEQASGKNDRVSFG